MYRLSHPPASTVRCIVGNMDGTKGAAAWWGGGGVFPSPSSPEWDAAVLFAPDLSNGILPLDTSTSHDRIDHMTIDYIAGPRRR